MGDPLIQASSQEHNSSGLDSGFSMGSDRKKDTSKSALLLSGGSLEKGILAKNFKSDLAGSIDSDAFLFSKYTFYWISKRANNKVYQVIIELPHTCSVLEAIEKVIPYFNQELEHISLNLDPKLYELFFAKKSGLPKSDYPALDESQNLNQTGIQCFTLVERNPTALMGAEMQAGKEEGKNQDYGSGKDGKGNMANPGMLSGGSASQSVNTSSTNNLGQDVEQGKQNEVQKCCFCIPIGSKKSAKSEKLISLKMDKEEGKSLSASLIDNQQ